MAKPAGETVTFALRVAEGGDARGSVRKQLVRDSANVAPKAAIAWLINQIISVYDLSSTMGASIAGLSDSSTWASGCVYEVVLERAQASSTVAMLVRVTYTGADGREVNDTLEPAFVIDGTVNSVLQGVAENIATMWGFGALASAIAGIA